jgi:hypothetical protein
MIVSDPKAASALSRPMPRRILMALMERERPLAEISAETGASMSLCHHHVRQLLELGLIEIASVERRSGAPIKHYRPTAEAFFVPAELLGRLPGDSHAAELREALDRSRAGALKGMLYAHDGVAVRGKLVHDEARPLSPSIELWLNLRLRDADARDLIQDLKALFLSYEAKSSGEKAYIVHGAVVAGKSAAPLSQSRK